MTETNELERSAARAAVDAVAMMNRARETAGVPQRELASRLGVGESRVSQILNGDGNVRMATLGRVLRALGYRLTLVVEPIDGDTPVNPRRPGRRRGRRAPEARSFPRACSPILSSRGNDGTAAEGSVRKRLRRGCALAASSNGFALMDCRRTLDDDERT